MDKHFFDSFRTGDYQRENFDSFLKAIKFHYDVPSIHVAGTNGKGSVSNYLAASYTENGYKVGKFTSPFLSEPNEMITINQKEISDDEFMNIYHRFEKEIKKYDLSAFEIQTLVAFIYFQDNKCDIAIIECGMGGEVDATNIFIPILSIITTISMEHTDYLGYSISEIAEQKGGIIKEDIPVLLGDLSEEAMTVLANIAKDNNSKMYFLGHPVNIEFDGEQYKFDYGEFRNIILNSLSQYSIYDCEVALEAISILKSKFSYDVNKVISGIEKVKMPCRSEMIHNNPIVILDGAHNPEGMERLCNNQNLYNLTQGKPLHIIFASFRDKNIANMLATAGTVTDDLTITTFDNPRARTEDEYFLFAGDYPFEEDPISLIKRKMEEFNDDVILVTGSLAFTAYVREAFKKGLL